MYFGGVGREGYLLSYVDDSKDLVGERETATKGPCSLRPAMP